jgi:hypothetical protein
MLGAYMVDRSAALEQLNQIIDVMNFLSDSVKQQETPNKEDFSHLVKILENYNNQKTNTDPKFLDDKKFALDPSIDETIRQAEEAVQVFRRMFPFATRNAPRSLNDKIAALYAALDKEKELLKFEANMKNLKERWTKFKAVVQLADKKELG